MTAAISKLLDGLPAERRTEFEAVHKVIAGAMPAGYEEVVGKNMLVYQVPIERYPDTYNKQPLMYVGLAAQKNYHSLYLMPAYGSHTHAQRLRDAFKQAGKKLDMGKSCIRFRKAQDLELDAIAEIVAAFPTEQWIQIAKDARKR